MAIKRDYYEVLGVGKQATAEEIRKAHRKLVRQYHPDANRNNPLASEKFKEVQEAYDVISEADKRAKYDQFGHAAFDTHSGQPDPGSYGDPSDAFRRGAANRNYRAWKASPNVTVEDFDFSGSGGAGGGGGFADIFEQVMGGRGRRRPAEPVEDVRGKDIEHAVTISFDQAARGCTVPLQLNRDGRVETIDLKIPSGVKEGSRIRLRGKGQPGASGRNGDLYIVTHVMEHAFYRREELDVFVDLPISMYESVLGTKVEVPTLDGRVTLTIPPGTSSGAKLRIKGKGIRRGEDCGDQFVVVKIIVPRGLNAEAKQMVSKLADEYPIDARLDVRWQILSAAFGADDGQYPQGVCANAA